jgi:L-ascorbate metabolism protein UlaG (beta-lactamase superfamily)
MDPYRAAEALTLLQPRMAIPIHWGALRPAGLGRFNPAFLTAPPLTFAKHAATMAPAVAVEILQPGGALTLDDTLS